MTTTIGAEDNPNIIFFLRHTLGLSQEKFAKLISCSRQRITRAENCKKESDIDEEIICKTYVLLDTIERNPEIFRFREIQNSIIVQLKDTASKYIDCSKTSHITSVINRKED